MALIYLYGDLSGTRLTKVYVAAGYVGHETKWAALDKEWRKALQFAKVDHFHATDFFANKPQGAFKGWKNGSRRHRAAEQAFTNAALSVEMVGLAFGIHTAGYPVIQDALAKAQARQKIRSIRMYCAELVLERVAQLNAKKPIAPGDRIAAYFEDEHGIGEVSAFYTFAKKRNAAWTKGFITVAPLEKKATRPLQVADLLAHAVWQKLEYGDDAIRPSQRRILQSGQVEVHLMDEEDCKATASLVPAFLEQFPTGLVLPPRQRKS